MSLHVMYSSMGVIAEILLYLYITLMCTVFICLIFFLLYMSREYHFYYIFILYVDTYIIFFIFTVCVTSA